MTLPVSDRLTMTNAHTADQTRNRIGVENIADHAIRFTLVKATFRTTCYNTTGILASVLKKRKAFDNLRGRVYGWVIEQ